jgi:Uma2 family endonuclease
MPAMRSTSLDRPFTWADYRRLPDSPLRLEVLDGELVVSPSPNVRHQRVLANLFVKLRRRIHDRGRGVVLMAPLDVKLSFTDVVQPDILVLIGADADRLTEGWLEGPPSLAVEILSPSTSRRDRGRKKARYAAHGVAEYWTVDPDADVVEQHVLDGDAYRAPVVHHKRITSPVLGLTIDLGSVFER